MNNIRVFVLGFTQTTKLRTAHLVVPTKPNNGRNTPYSLILKIKLKNSIDKIINNYRIKTVYGKRFME